MAFLYRISPVIHPKENPVALPYEQGKAQAGLQLQVMNFDGHQVNSLEGSSLQVQEDKVSNKPLILAHPEKTIRPKIDYFESLGLRGPDLPRIICSNKFILLSSLKKQIIPTINFLRGIIHTNENLIYALKQSSLVIRCNIKKVLVPNISTLRAHGVPEKHVAGLLMMQPKSLMLRIDLFKEVVCAIKAMGFDPTRGSFILAVRSMSLISKVNWEKKKEVLRSFGWSENDFLTAFRVQPMLMICSQKKVRYVLDFLTTKGGLISLDVARCPNLFLLSVEKRMIPRCAVLQVLMSKGLVSKDIDLVWQLNHRKEDFEKKFLTPFMEEVPAVIEAYQENKYFMQKLFDGEPTLSNSLKILSPLTEIARELKLQRLYAVSVVWVFRNQACNVSFCKPISVQEV
ncbi:hypothetical protein CFP56_037982 [Quercus suber]|uniref:Uncharacterized protein n=1 Tax=Quercus suber TaxID=58331 RepID=A0AAW0LQL6_QUESU